MAENVMEFSSSSLSGSIEKLKSIGWDQKLGQREVLGIHNLISGQAMPTKNYVYPGRFKKG